METGPIYAKRQVVLRDDPEVVRSAAQEKPNGSSLLCTYCNEKYGNETERNGNKVFYATIFCDKKYKYARKITKGANKPGKELGCCNCCNCEKCKKRLRNHIKKKANNSHYSKNNKKAKRSASDEASTLDEYIIDEYIDPEDYDDAAAPADEESYYFDHIKRNTTVEESLYMLLTFIYIFTVCGVL